MRIKDLELSGPFVAAPMAGVSSPAFRLMARRSGASLAYTEMVSAVGLVRGHKLTWDLCQVTPQERPVALQLFGSDPSVMHQAARLVAQMPVDVVDVNLGCPAKKIRRQGAGSALLDDPVLAAEIVAAVVQAAEVPVTAKLRLGFKSDQLEEILPGVLKAGVAALCLHARTAKQGFAGAADWQAIARLKTWCPVPLIGNGDVRSGAQAVAMLKETGCDGVMIGRAALGNPWIFERALARLAGREPRQVPVAERRAALWEHMEMARLHGGPNQALHFARQFMMWYSKGLPESASFRRQAGRASDLASLISLTDSYFNRLEALENTAAEQLGLEAAS
jgi:tRNA-dihydrouridine synthase B